MSFRKVTDTFLQVAKQYQQDMAEAVNYLEEQGLYGKMNSGGVKTVDTRDFAPMVALMGVNGNTPEERAADIHAKIDELAAVFGDPDHSKRKPYLDMIYDLTDSFDPETVDMDDPEQVSKLLQSYLLDQTVGVKMEENREYYSQRYPTKEIRNAVEAQSRFCTAAFSHITTNLLDNRIKINVGLTLPMAIPKGMDNIQNCRINYAKMQRDEANAILNGAAPSKDYELPVLDEMIPYANKDVTDVLAYSKEEASMLYDYLNLMVVGNLMPSEGKNMQGLKEAHMVKSTDALYVDGMHYDDFLKKQFPGRQNEEGLNSKLIGTLIMNGRHRLDIVHSYRNEAGEMQYEAKNIRAAITPEQEKRHLMQYSWIRRTLFNWGPFRIETLQEKQDRMANDPETEARYAKICADQKDKVETNIAKVEEEARQKKIAEAKKAEKTAAANKEKKRLDDSVEQWEKDSVIGILGQQIKGSYNAIRLDLALTAEKDRYDKIAEKLAKQVLYTQLCNERADNGGEIGHIEKSLMGDGNLETIQNNIAVTAKQMAQNATMKDLFFEKVGISMGAKTEKMTLSTTKFDTFIATGGCQRFTQEYMMKLGETSMQKEQPDALANEKTIQKEEAVNIMP